MKLYSYVLTHDTGFAPNPYWNVCTLSCCKPRIRQSAGIGDWVVGIGSKSGVGSKKIIYAMKVTEKLTFDAYAKSRRFRVKIPAAGGIKFLGDNIYYRDGNDQWVQRRSMHQRKHMGHDLSSNAVLISNEFYYFGNSAIQIPKRFLTIIKKGPGHKCRFPGEFVKKFVGWLKRNYRSGRRGRPNMFAIRQSLMANDARCKNERRLQTC